MNIFAFYIRKQLQFLKCILIPCKVLFRLIRQGKHTPAFLQVLRIQRIDVQVTDIGIRIQQKMVRTQIGKIFKMFFHHGKEVLLFMCDPVNQQGFLRFRQFPKVHAAQLVPIKEIQVGDPVLGKAFFPATAFPLR